MPEPTNPADKYIEKLRDRGICDDTCIDYSEVHRDGFCGYKHRIGSTGAESPGESVIPGESCLHPESDRGISSHGPEDSPRNVTKDLSNLF